MYNFRGDKIFVLLDIDIMYVLYRRLFNIILDFCEFYEVGLRVIFVLCCWYSYRI